MPLGVPRAKGRHRRAMGTAEGGMHGPDGASGRAQGQRGPQAVLGAPQFSSLPRWGSKAQQRSARAGAVCVPKSCCFVTEHKQAALPPKRSPPLLLINQRPGKYRSCWLCLINYPAAFALGKFVTELV